MKKEFYNYMYYTNCTDRTLDNFYIYFTTSTYQYSPDNLPDFWLTWLPIYLTTDVLDHWLSNYWTAQIHVLVMTT